jgi:glycosyltransferase involved in cell wall biosynthesis
MRILHVYKDYYPVLGGIENHVRTLAEAQAARGHTVSVLVTSRDRRTHVEYRNGVRVIFAARLAMVASTPLSIALLSALARERPDIAHLHFPYPLGDVAQFFFGRACRTVITYHSDIVRQKVLLRFYAPFLRRSLARADCLLATSPRYVETSPFLAPYASKCVIVPYGIDTTRFETADPAQVEALRAQFDGPLILFVGQLRYYKGVEYLIRAMADTPGRALIIGSETTTRLEELRTIAQTVGVADRVVFLGEQNEDLPVFYHACDLFVLPSVERSEAFGIVQLEAMAAGKPVVSCDVGTGVAWVNQHEVTGLVTPPRDPAALAAALGRLLKDPALRARMGAAGRERAVRLFTCEAMIERVEAVYREVL